MTRMSPAPDRVALSYGFEIGFLATCGFEIG